MAKKLWQKHWQLDVFIESFETKDDLFMDQKLVPYDVYGSIAHAKMLEKIGILTEKEFAMAKKGLLVILKQYQKGVFNLHLGDEDVNTKIENYLTEHIGEVGKKIHTGRSRNDQILTAIRLFTKEELLQIWQELMILIEGFLSFSKKYEFIPMPGYTHMQKAMPSSVGMWAGSFAEGLIDDLKVLKTAYELNNQSPLGSAASYGIPLPIDRALTAKLLGFSNVQSNSLYCQNSRGKIEAIVLSALIAIFYEVNKFASDVLLFTTSEFNFFTIHETLLSGSSIMPQKKNVDIAELLRSKLHVVLGNYTTVASLSSNLISGFNRDLQDSKKPLFESLEITLGSIKAASLLINKLTPNEEILKQALTPEIFATHKALELVKQGMPFRKAYKTIGENIQQLVDQDSTKILHQSIHIGATGNLGLNNLANKIKKEKSIFLKANSHFKKTISMLIGGED